MTITPSSLAAGNLVSVENQQFAVTAQVLPQKNVYIGTFDEVTFPLLTPNVPFQIFSPDDVASKTGRGFMLHRLVKAGMKPGKVESWIIPQLEDGSDPDHAVGTLDFTGSSDTNEAGTGYLYIAGDLVRMNFAANSTDTQKGEVAEDAINADDDLPVTANNVAGVVTVTSKSGGPWGNDIDLSIGNAVGPDVVELPTGVACTITGMAGGAGIPDIQDALDALGTGDSQNEEFFTNLIHGYGMDVGTLNAISTYNGVGNTFIGNYKKEVARPFRSLVGDTTAGAVGLAIDIGFALARRTDRTNGLIPVPGSQSHPQEIAAQMIGLMAVTNSNRAQEGFINKALDGVWPGAKADRWTSEYDDRDTAVKSGLSTTLVKSGVVYAQNIITFCRPVDVAAESNGYRAMRNISIIQNLLYNYKANFDRSKWQGISIVEDVKKVSNVNDRLKARDVNSVLDDLVALADEFAGNSWLYNASYTISELQKGDKVTLRAGLTGFDIQFPVILSGEGGIYNSVIYFDTSIAVLLTGGV